MKSKQTVFFSTLEDIQPILKTIEELYKIQYFEMGLFDYNIIPNYNSIFEIPGLGLTDYGDWNYDKRLLILPTSLSLKIREVPQKKGGIKYAVDPLINPISICLQCGGIFTKKENVLVAGKIGMMSDEKFAIELYKKFLSEIKKQFNKIEGFYVGKNAEKKLRDGWRLVMDEGRAKEYDLSLNQA